MYQRSLALEGNGPWADIELPLSRWRVAVEQAQALGPALPAALREVFDIGFGAATRELEADCAQQDDEPCHFSAYQRRMSGDTADAFRRHCHLMAGASTPGAVYKIRAEMSYCMAGVYVAGIGSVIVQIWKHERETATLEYSPLLADFFFPSYQDRLGWVELPYPLWGPSYCADKLAQSGADGASVKPFQYQGALWVNTGSSSAAHDRALTTGTIWRLCPLAQWHGPTYSYQSQGRAVDQGHIERSDRSGQLVKVRGVPYVLAAAMHVYSREQRQAASATRSPVQVETPAQEPEPELTDINGAPLRVNSRCVVAFPEQSLQTRSMAGQFLRIAKLSPKHGYVWVYTDKPVTYRTNRNGRRVIDHDPRCIQSPMAADSLRLA
jgi:hypothetical protein